MAALGANVTAVEPQVDLARALQESGELNCWGDRLRAHAAYVEVDPAKAALGTMKSIPGFRVGGRRNDLQFPPVPGTSLLLAEADGKTKEQPVAQAMFEYQDYLWELKAKIGLRGDPILTSILSKIRTPGENRTNLWLTEEE